VGISRITKDTARLVVEASSRWSQEQRACFSRACANEKLESAKWAMNQLVKNEQVSSQNAVALCDDTGTAHPFLEIGDNAILPAGFLKAMEEGIRQGLNELPARPMGVKGDVYERITQEKGLYDEPGMLMPAPTQIRRVPGDSVELTILMLGGGPEIRSRTEALFHMHSLEHVVQTMIEWAIPQVALLGCQPCTLSFGIGRTAVEASSLSLEAMKEGRYDVQTDMEKRITDAVNQAGIGPIGLGGNTSVYATFVKIGHMRASGFRVVSMRPNCCVEIRKASKKWSSSDLSLMK
jgi:fumarate hydratase subunit alpha